MFSLQDKNIVVTGASSGIGREIAIYCNRQGANVLLIARDADRLHEVIDTFEYKTKSAVLSIDLSSVFDTEVIMDAMRKMGPIHGLVHAAGTSPTMPFKNIKLKDFQNVFSLNVYASIQLSQLVLKPDIRAEKLSIIYIASVLSETGEKGKSLYAMTKSALLGLVKSCALEYANKGIRFNAISPSVIDTPLSFKSEYRKEESAMVDVLKKHPLGLGHTSDVASAAVFLLSDESKWITGTNMIIDGGYLAN
jgi:NAD(P)-dependent dehydrogenase (short-subunit alcohol dehydrogenase family)